MIVFTKVLRKFPSTIFDVIPISIPFKCDFGLVQINNNPIVLCTSLEKREINFN